MGLMSKLKGALSFVTGGAAKVTIEYSPATVFPGQSVNVKITATSTGSEVKSKGVFIDLHAVERVSVRKRESADLDDDLHLTMTTTSEEQKIAEPFVLGKDETRIFEGVITMPQNIQPSFNGQYVAHDWEIRGRVEAKGNDPDSGFQPLRVGLAH